MQENGSAAGDSAKIKFQDNLGHPAAALQSMRTISQMTWGTPSHTLT
jgi:hypothetical protein